MSDILKDDMHSELSKPLTIDEMKLALAEHVIMGMRQAAWSAELMREFTKAQHETLRLQRELILANDRLAKQPRGKRI